MGGYREIACGTPDSRSSIAGSLPNGATRRGPLMGEALQVLYQMLPRPQTESPQ